METKVLEKGHIALPSRLRRKLGIQEGDKLEADIKNGGILLSLIPAPKPKKSRKSRVVVDPNTGFPVIDVGNDAPVLTNEMVREMLADFP